MSKIDRIDETVLKPFYNAIYNCQPLTISLLICTLFQVHMEWNHVV